MSDVSIQTPNRDVDDHCIKCGSHDMLCECELTIQELADRRDQLKAQLQRDALPPITTAAKEAEIAAIESEIDALVREAEIAA